MHSEICPVCLGKAKIGEVTCHGCNGKGWIEVQDSHTSIFQYIPYYPRPYEPYTPYPDPYQPYYTPNTSGDYIVPPDAQISWC